MLWYKESNDRLRRLRFTGGFFGWFSFHFINIWESKILICQGYFVIWSYYLIFGVILKVFSVRQYFK